MPEFHLDTNGGVEALPGSGLAGVIHFADDLDSFTQGYIEAMFFTECGSETDGKELGDAGFSDLAPEALARIIADCSAFQATDAYKTVREAEDNEELGDLFEGSGGVSGKAGRDFWYTRNGHGAGFGDGDWPEPYATALDSAAKAAGVVGVYLGDDGKVHLS